jgi:bifunctional non-homologous end joining protein LigD
VVALNEDGWPHFPLVCDRLLNGKTSIRLTYIVFDVLEHEGQDKTRLPYSERRSLLDSLELDGLYWRTSPAFDDGEAVFTACQERRLEGVVAKRRGSIYRPGERGSWVKVKNRGYWRYPLELEGALRVAASRVRGNADEPEIKKERDAEQR